MFLCPPGLDIEWIQSEYTVPEEQEDDQNIVIRVGDTEKQMGFHLSLTARELGGGDGKASEGQDFSGVPVTVEVPRDAVGLHNISLRDIIIRDASVESRLQKFKLEVGIVERGVYFDSGNSTERVANVTIESADGMVHVVCLLCGYLKYSTRFCRGDCSSVRE